MPLTRQDMLLAIRNKLDSRTSKMAMADYGLGEAPSVDAGSEPETFAEKAVSATGSRVVPDLELLLAHRETVFLVCLGYLRNRWDAEDMAQETYLRAHSRLRELRRPELARAWICRIARNACLDHLRRAKVRRLFALFSQIDEHTAPAQCVDIEEKERIAELRAAMESLPSRLRDVLVMREYGELTYEEIAKALGLRMGTVMSRLNRARATLAKRLRGGRS